MTLFLSLTSLSCNHLERWQSYRSFYADFSQICTVHAQKLLFPVFRSTFITIRFTEPRFPKIAIIWRLGDVFRRFFPLYISKIYHISISGLFNLKTLNMFHMLCSALGWFYQVWSRSCGPDDD